MMELSDVVMI